MIRRVIRRLRSLGHAALRPWRRCWRRHSLVLCYHRVAAPAARDPWSLRVAPERFREQLEVLRRHAELVPLSELERRATRRGARPVVALTFDDGYADNLRTALPMLEAAAAPATFFVVSSAIERGTPFWWDQLAELEDDPSRLAALQAELAVADTATRDSALQRLAASHGKRLPALGDDLPLSVEELQRLQRSPLVEIGAHGVEHRFLPRLDGAALQRELRGSLDACERLTGARPQRFAYPYGVCSRGAARGVASCGFSQAFTTVPDLAWAGGNPLRIPRFCVGDWAAERFERTLRWFWLP